MITSLNACGRHIPDPTRSILDQKMDRAKRLKIPEGERPNLIPPENKPVQISVCDAFYKSKNKDDLSSDCKKCISKTGEDDIDCSCTWESGNFCNFAFCVENEFKKYNRCVNTYNSIFNQDDFKDANYSEPFTSKNLKHCMKMTNEKFEQVDSDPSDSDIIVSDDKVSIWQQLTFERILFLFLCISALYIFYQKLRPSRKK